jgi:hypothetical protein
MQDTELAGIRQWVWEVILQPATVPGGMSRTWLSWSWQSVVDVVRRPRSVLVARERYSVRPPADPIDPLSFESLIV